MVARLPSIDGDVGFWGTLLNEFLLVGHNADGTLKEKIGKITTAAGDDSTDDYAAWQADLNAAAAGTTVYGVKGATYRLSNTLIPPDGVTIDFNGAVVKAGATRSGTLASGDRLIDLTSRTGVTIKNGRFLQPVSSFAGSSERSLILLDGGGFNVITRNEFTISSGGHTAVRLRNGANDCEVSHNKLDGYGIMYSQARDSITGVAANGTSRTRCMFNRIVNAPVDGLKGLGNGLTAVYNDDCQVVGNIIINSGRMGIEDFAQCRGTLIAHNTVDTTGLITPSVGIGISAVSSSGTRVMGNVVKSPATFGIELGSSGTEAIGNSIEMSSGSTDVAMSLDSEGTNGAYGLIVQGNIIKGGAYCIRSASTHALGSTTISGNHIYDWKNMGIDCAASSGLHIVIGNTLQQSVPNSFGVTRVGINAGTSSPVIGNVVTFRSSASGGANVDKLCQLFRDNQIVSGNTFDAGGITSPAVPTVNAAGGAPTDITVMHNVFVGGATLSVSTITRPRVAHNVGLATISGTPTLGFFNVTPVAKPAVTGSRGGNAALASLLTQLAALGLITDSSSA